MEMEITEEGIKFQPTLTFSFIDLPDKLVVKSIRMGIDKGMDNKLGPESFEVVEPASNERNWKKAAMLDDIKDIIHMLRMSGLPADIILEDNGVEVEC